MGQDKKGSRLFRDSVPKKRPLRGNIRKRKGSHTTTPGPSLAKEGSLRRARNPIQRSRMSEKVTNMFV